MAKSDILVRWKADTSNYDANIAKARRQLQGFATDNYTAGGAMKQLTSQALATAAKFASLGAAISGAMKVAKDAFMQSESNIDEWGRTMEGAKSAYSVFLDTLNGGNWSQFFRNLELAIQGGRDLYDALDRLGSVKANNQLAVATVEAQIQQLRVMKQQGKNVDDQLKAATERLKALRMEEVNAGRKAGVRQMTNALTNRVRGISGGENISGLEIGAAVGQYATRGQRYMDEQAAILARLQKKASYNYSQSVVIPGATSMSADTEYTGIDLSRLTNEERKQYIIAKAVTEGETELQQGLGTLTQSVREQAAVWQQAFRNNRYSLLGKGNDGGTSGKNGGVRGTSLFSGEGIGTTESMKELLAQRSYYQRQMNTAMDYFSAADAQAGLERVQRLIDAQPLALRLGIPAEEMANIKDKINELGKNIKPIDFSGGKSGVKTAKETATAWSSAAQAVSNVGSALQSIDDPSAKVAGIVAQAIANIALGFAQASASPATGAAGVFGWIAAATAGIATMVATITSIKNATAGSYAEGGIVPGSSFSGDNMYGRLNAGELILSRSQQSAIASQLSDRGGSSRQSQPYVSGELIYLGLNNYLRRSNRGELMTSMG